MKILKDTRAAKIKDYYRGAERCGALIAECDSFKDLDQALATAYRNEDHPGVQGETEAQRAIKEIRHKLHKFREEV